MRWNLPLALALALAPLQALHAQPDDGMAYVLTTGANHSSTINASTNDMHHANRYRTGNAPLLYARDGGTAYVIRDAAVIGRARNILRPQEELGARQGELGRKQGDLGARQAKLGMEQGRLGLLAGQFALNPSPRLNQISAQQHALGRQQGELGAQQAALGAKQAAMGQQQAELARLAQPKLRALVDDAVRRGLAQRVN